MVGGGNLFFMVGGGRLLHSDTVGHDILNSYIYMIAHSQNEIADTVYGNVVHVLPNATDVVCGSAYDVTGRCRSRGRL